MLDDLHLLPKFRDSLSYLYIEHARIDRHEKSVAIHNPTGIVPVPASSLVLLMLGPGVSVTLMPPLPRWQNSTALWSGAVKKTYASTRSARVGHAAAHPILHQARLVADESKRLEVVKRMYRMRFRESYGFCAHRRAAARYGRRPCPGNLCKGLTKIPAWSGTGVPMTVHGLAGRRSGQSGTLLCEQPACTACVTPPF